ncbi:hypothetical protein V2J09_002776 [Rumex salicifolius]
MSQLKFSAMRSSPLSPLLRRAFCTSTAATPTPSQSPGVIKSLADDLYRTRDLKKLAEKFLKSSENERFRKKTGIYEEVVRRLYVGSRFKLVKKVLEAQKQYSDITKEGFGARLISLYGRSGMLSDAVKVFDEMPKLNSERTILSVNAVLAACINSKKYDRVEELFRKLPAEVGVEPDVVSYNTVIKAYVKLGVLDKAVLVLDEMEKKACNADSFTYNTLLHGLYKGDKFADGEKIWDKMQKSGVTPDIRSYNAKLAGLASEKKPEQALELLEEMKAYSNVGNLEEAKKWYDELKRIGCKPDKRVVDELVVLLKFEEAKELLELGKSNNYRNYKLKMPLDAE